jgi:hypothetical protein
MYTDHTAGIQGPPEWSARYEAASKTSGYRFSIKMPITTLEIMTLTKKTNGVRSQH